MVGITDRLSPGGKKVRYGDTNFPFKGGLHSDRIIISKLHQATPFTYRGEHPNKANSEGTLQVLLWKRSEPTILGKMELQAPITAMQLAGAPGTPKDKIFVATGNIVTGYTKKLKMFLQFDTNLGQPIRSMYVDGSHLLVAGVHVFNQFEDCQDTGFYVSDDEINFVITLSLEKVKEVVPVLACKDRSLRALNKGTVKYSVHLEGIPTTLCLIFNEGGENGGDIIYGTTDGKLGLARLTAEEGSVKWEFDTEVSAVITCLDFYDLTYDGNKELIVGCDDGTVLVYKLDLEIYETNLPRLIFSQSCSESITGIQGGVFGSDGFEEIVVSTNSGWVFGLSSETTDKKVRVDEGNYTISEDTKRKLIKLKSDIEELGEKVAVEREKYQLETKSGSAGLARIPHFKVNDKMVLSRDDASYLLVLEVESPIDTILIQSDVPVDLLDVDKNSAVVSFSQCDPDSGNFLLTTFRCQANTTRIEVRIRTIEGQFGSIQAYVTPRISPKCCQVKSFPIKPLSLHVRTHTFDRNRPYNSLSLNGEFSLAEMHSWLVDCLPEMPDRYPSSGEASLTFVSSFLGTILHCTYGKGEARFQSDNVSTISILKDCLSKEASKKNISLEMDSEFNEESILHTLQLIRPKLDGFLALSKQVSLIDTLKEIEAHDNDANSFLSPEYKYILENSEKLKNLHKRQPSYLDRLYGMITDLYIDKHKYNGINVKHRVPHLIEVLERQDFELLLDFFQASTSNTIVN